MDKKQFIALLAVKTGLGEEQVRKQLDNLIDRIHETTARGETVTIDDFGTFFWKEGSLQFEPAPVLATEINQNYAGMKPIELMGAFKDTGSDEAIEIEAAASQPEKAEEPQPEEIPKSTEKTETGKPKTSGKEKPERTPAAKKAGSGKRRSRKTLHPARKRKPKMIVAAAIIIIIVLGLGGWFVYANMNHLFHESKVSSPLPAKKPHAVQPTPTTSTVIRPNQDSLAQKNHPAKTDSAEQSTSDTVTSRQENKAAANRQSLYGLMGSVNPKANNGYTIFVHSFRRKSIVQNIQNQLQAKGYRAILVKAHVDSSIYWRVGIGQFRTFKKATQVADTLPEPFQSHHFIGHIHS